MKLRGRDPALLRMLVFLGALLGLALLLVFASRILLPLLLGLVVAYLLDPAVSWFERRGRSRMLGTIVVSTFLLLFLVGFLLLVVPAIGGQVQHLRERMPQYQAQIQARVLPWFDRIRASYPEQVDELVAGTEALVREKWPQMARSAARWLGSIFSSVLGFVLFLLDLVFVPVFAFYLMVDFPKIRRGVRGLIPLAYREVTLSRLGEVDTVLASFVRGQLTIALILAAINGIGLTLLGVPMGLLIGIIAGLANLIPYMALVIGLAPALLLCWIEHQSLARLVGVLLVFGGAQLLEGTILSPRILSKSVNLHPVWVLLSIIVGGRLFGLTGMLIAVPAAAAIQVFVRHWLVSYHDSDVYRGGRASPAGEGPEAAVPPGAGGTA